MRSNYTDTSAQSHELQEKGREQLFGKKKLILGVSRTGAKFTPKNHKDTGDRVFDAINSGDLIDVEQERIKAELKALKSLDVKYIHEHARNPVTHEQSADTSLYQSFSKLARSVDPSAMLSFGASRNGTEISAVIKDGGELARTRHAGLSIADGGAEFVTSQAAIELQIVTDLERQGFVQIDHASGDWKLLRDFKEYVPSGSIEGAKLEVHSTTGGSNYGASSASVQMDTLNWSIARRRELGLPFEVEWVQHGRSSLLTWFLIHGLEDGLGSVGRLNITILFGFSPRLPFPKRYADFKRVVDAARSVSFARNGQDRVRLKVSVSVGAAVLPQHALEQVCTMDVGPMKGQLLQPVDRLTGYAAMPDSGVDILRVGMEDTPYMVDRARNVVPTTNSQLAERARGFLETCGANVVTNERVLKNFSRI